MEDFHEVPVPDSTRSLSLTTIKGSTVLLASEPSDCLHLQREHVHGGTFRSLVVRFDVPANDKNLEQWKEGLSHLLHTYSPLYLEICSANKDIGILDGLQVSLQDGTDYIARAFRESHIIIHKGYAKCVLNHVEKYELLIIILSILVFLMMS